MVKNSWPNIVTGVSLGILGEESVDVSNHTRFNNRYLAASCAVLQI